MAKPLAGFRMLELPGDVATRYCARLFAQLGAAVTQVGTPDDGRIGYGAAAGATYGRWLDEGKTRVDAAAEAVGPFDLILCGQDAAGVALGRAVRERSAATLLELTWFDPDGPYGAWAATDEVIAALNGTAFSFGERDGPPMLAQGHAPQITAGLVAFNAGLAALLHPPARRPSTVTVNVLEAALCFAETGAMSSRADGSRSTRLGVNRFAPTYPCSAYRTADGWVGITCLTPAQWASLCRVIQRPDVAADARFAASFQRLLLGDEVDAILKPCFAQKTTAEWVALGDANRIPTAPMPEPGQLPGVEHWAARGAFAPVPGEAAQGPTLPYRMTFDGETSPRWNGDAARGPLAGVRVVDFAMGWAGPLCARTLGDLGAEVIKIESEGHPDWWRGWEAGSVDPATRETKHNFLAVNRNKRGVCIDLTTPDGIARAKALIARADVVVENFAAGVLEKLGLGPAAQRALRPGIITVSMPAFGNGGPLSGIRAYGSTVEQASGLPFVNGEAHWPPCNQHVAFGDPVAGLYGASAVLAALAGRDRLGGAYVDLAQVACLFQLGADAILAAQAGPLPRTGHRRRRLALCTVVAARDGGLAGAADEAALEQVRALLGADAALAAWAVGRTAIEAAQALQGLGAPAAPVLAGDGLTHDPQLNAAGFWGEMDRAFVGRHHMCQSPYRFDGARPALVRAAPTLGEHTDEVLAELDAG